MLVRFSPEHAQAVVLKRHRAAGGTAARLSVRAVGLYADRRLGRVIERGASADARAIRQAPHFRFGEP
jgi:hypothetical protein